MAVRQRDELINIVSDYIGDNNDDKAIALLEDVSDTLNSYDGEDWKSKYEENDKKWREKYRARFVNGNQIRKDEMEDAINESEQNANTAVEDVPDEEADRKELEEAVFKADEERKEV